MNDHRDSFEWTHGTTTSLGRMDRRALLARGAALGLSGSALANLLAACGGSGSSGSASAGGAPKRGGTIVFANNQDALSLNPIGPVDNGSIWQMMQIYDQLCEVLPGSLEPQPGLAESWTQSSDGLSYTFTLRKARFSNGDPVTADDVKFSLDRFMDPKINVNYSFASASWKAVTITDPTTVRVDLKRPDGAFLYNIGYFGASIVPKEVVEQVGDKAFGNHPVGSGAFMVKEYTHGVRLKLVRNPHYWRAGRPYLDGLTFELIPDDTTRMLKVQSGEAQVGASVPFSQAAEISHANGVRLQDEKFAAIYSVWLNHTYAPLADLKVRQAMNYAAPKSQIIKTALFGYGTAANDVLPPVKYWDADVPAYDFDMAKAKSTLAASGYKTGFDLTLNIPAGDTISQQTAQILKAQWSQLGINTSIAQLDIGTVWSKWLAGNAQASMFPPNAWTADLPVDDSTSLSVLDYWTGGKSFFTYYKSRQAQKYAETASGSVSDSVRRQNFNALQALAMRDAVTVPLVFPPSLTAVRTNVQDFHTLLNGWWRFEQVWLT